MIGRFDRFSDLTTRYSVQDYSVAFRSQGKPTQMQYSSELEYNNNATRNNTDLSGSLVQQDASMPGPTPPENDRVIAHYATWNARTDYMQPINAHGKLEAGFKGTQRHSVNEFTAAYLEAGSRAYLPDPARASAFDYLEDIGAGYAVLSQQVAKLQTQAGLRLETANTRLALPTLSQTLTSHYASAFPSGIVSYNLTDARQAKISYSRRITRPNPHQLSPVEYRLEARTLFRGNPNLRPEYTDAIELGLQEAHSWGSIQLNPYLRHTAHAVRNIQFVDSSGASVSTYENVASTVTMGSDLNVNARHGPLTLGGGGSAYHYSSDASNLSGNPSAKAIVWSLRANGTWKFSPRFDVQVFTNYRAPYATEGGSQLASAFMSVGSRYKAWGDQGSISFSVLDPFGLQKFGYRTANGTAIEQSEQYFGARAAYLTITRNFGQAVKLRPKQPDADGTCSPGLRDASESRCKRDPHRRPAWYGR